MIPELFIVDTSVWIDFFRGTLEPVYYELLTEGIREDRVVITDIIRHEILVGARSEKLYKGYLHLLEPLKCLTLPGQTTLELAHFAWFLAQEGLMGRYTDVAIAFQSHKGNIPILSFDHYFFKLAQKKWITTLLQNQ